MLILRIIIDVLKVSQAHPGRYLFGEKESVWVVPSHFLFVSKPFGKDVNLS